MQKKLTLICILLCASFMVAAQQTTLANYNYISFGHNLEVNNGLAPNPDYTFTLVSNDTCIISSSRRIISTIYKVEHKINGTLHPIGYKVVMKDSYSSYFITVCQPNRTSSNDVIALYLNQINGFIPEFTKAWNQITIKLL